MSEETTNEGKVSRTSTSTAPSGGNAPASQNGEIERLFREYNRRVLRAAFRITGNLDDAQDVLQTVFTRLVHREGGTPLSDTPGNYLHRAAINAALDVVRSRRAARSQPLEDVEPVMATEARQSPERLHGSTEIRDRVRAALAGMSAKNAEAFALRYFEGYGNHEIARMLGTSRSTVNVMLHRTRQRLRQEIASFVGEAS